MPAGRIGHLDHIGMIWDRLDDAWMSAYRELRAFHGLHGHFEVPRTTAPPTASGSPNGRAPSATPAAPGN